MIPGLTFDQYTHCSRCGLVLILEELQDRYSPESGRPLISYYKVCPVRASLKEDKTADEWIKAGGHDRIKAVGDIGYIFVPDAL